MANIYVRSTTGNNSNNGSSWALAKANLGGAATIDVAGDTIYVSQAHAETNATGFNLNWAGQVAKPNRIICVDDSATPPVAAASTAQAAFTGNATLTINGHIYCYGLRFVAGDAGSSGSGGITLGTGSDVQIYEKCRFEVNGSLGGFTIPTNTGSIAATILWKDCSARFSGSGQQFLISNGRFHWQGGSLLADSVTPTALIHTNSKLSNVLIENVDLSTLSATFDIVRSSAQDTLVVLRNCKLPAGWTGQLVGASQLYGTLRAEMYNCDSADTNYRVWIKDYWGELRQETTLVQASGASDGATAFSWKIVTTQYCTYRTGEFRTPEIVRWNDTVGTPIAVTVEILHDSLTLLNDDEIWLEVSYLGTSGYPLGVLVTDTKADVMATAAPQLESSAIWVTTGLTNPKRQKLSVTFTPQKRGFLHARVCMGKASYTVYVDPFLATA